MIAVAVAWVWGASSTLRPGDGWQQQRGQVDRGDLQLVVNRAAEVAVQILAGRPSGLPPTPWPSR